MAPGIEVGASHTSITLVAHIADNGEHMVAKCSMQITEQEPQILCSYHHKPNQWHNSYRPSDPRKNGGRQHSHGYGELATKSNAGAVAGIRVNDDIELVELVAGRGRNPRSSSLKIRAGCHRGQYMWIISLKNSPVRIQEFAPGLKADPSPCHRRSPMFPIPMLSC